MIRDARKMLLTLLLCAGCGSAVDKVPPPVESPADDVFDDDAPRSQDQATTVETSDEMDGTSEGDGARNVLGETVVTAPAECIDSRDCPDQETCVGQLCVPGDRLAPSCIHGECAGSCLVMQNADGERSLRCTHEACYLDPNSDSPAEATCAGGDGISRSCVLTRHCGGALDCARYEGSTPYCTSECSTDDDCVDGTCGEIVYMSGNNYCIPNRLIGR